VYKLNGFSGPVHQSECAYIFIVYEFHILNMMMMTMTATTRTVTTMMMMMMVMMMIALMGLQ
jgi:hypothetical protein